ncbi:MAG: Ig-like domain-containing protein [Planctomycetota bacterium]
MTDELIIDSGRQTGDIDRLDDLIDNHGPLIRRNTTDNVASPVAGERQLNGLRIRGGELVAGSVWDDTDIAHVLFESVVVGNYVSSGGLVLRSQPDESLVVKFAGRGTPNSDTAGTGITATGSTGDISDRIGGTVQVLGLPGAPVVLTSLKDDSIGAGRRIDGTAQNDTNGDSFGSRPSSNDWRSLFFDTLSNDRNLAIVPELESSVAAPPGLNATVQNAQILGERATRLTTSDEQQRLGFEVDGFISAPGDIDTYSFTAAAGTQIWVDVDKTSVGLDTVIEVIDDLGNVIARSDDSFVEIENESELDILDNEILAGPLGNADSPLTRRWSNGQYYDDASANLKDAGLRITLPGVVGTRSSYFVRVRSASVDPGDVAGGATSGAYSFQVRLREEQEFPGSVVRFADIRYANHGVHVQGLPGSSPLVGEAQENESVDPFSDAARGQVIAPFSGGYGIEDEPRYGSDVYANNDAINGGVFAPFNPFSPTVVGARPQNLGDLADSKTGTLSVGGELSTNFDVDFYQFDIDRAGQLDDARRATIFDIDYADGFDRPDTNISVFYSASGNPSTARLVLFGESSNVLDDLNSPLSTQLVGELLERGSITGNDPLIGPVALPAGSYFVAVTDAGRVPTQLTDNTRVRRSPIDSSVRIFDDHVESIGGTTADAPVEREFVETVSPGWVVTEDRGNDQGHGRVTTFDSVLSSPLSSPAVPSLATAPFFPQANATLAGQTGNPPTELPIDIPEDAYVPDQLILAFNEDVSDAAKQLFLGREGLTVSKSFQTISAIVVETQPGENIPQLAYRLSGEPEIQFAEPDFIMQTSLVPNDPLYDTQWHYNNTGQTGGVPGADISLEEAWDVSVGSPEVVVAVIDSGIDLTHPDLVSNLWVNPGEIPGDGIDNDGNGFIDDINGIDGVEGDVIPQDIIGHGTHVAGTVGAAGNNGIGVSGVNQNVSLMILRNCDIFCPQSASIASVDYATNMRLNHGINVVVSNNSYGGPFPSLASQQAIEAHTAAGIMFVAATGNDGLNNDIFPQFPANYDVEGIVAVAATDDRDQNANFSNVGAANTDIHAPGVNIISTTLNGTYGPNTGTSMASPHVAGVAGLLASVAPNATLLELQAALFNGADPLPQLDGLSVTGARLNAAGAIAALPTTSSRNESYYFDRSEDTGTLTSNPFDLVGYTAADKPRFYFDFFVEATRDDIIGVQVTSDQLPDPFRLPINLATLSNTVWQQAVLDLDVVAGHSNIRVEFIYDVDLTETAEGLYLDNFIVGFAERGEMVADAALGQATFTSTPESIPGHYQLEIRPGTDYTTTLPTSLLVERTLAADPLLIDPVFFEFSSGRGITPYETFSLDVFNRDTGLDETLVFQFVPNDINLQDDSLEITGAISIGYNVTDPATGGPESITSRVISAMRTLPAELSFFDIETRSIELTSSFDTNERHAEQITMIAPDSSQIADGDTFVLSDGSSSLTFEFSTDTAIQFGNIRVPFTPGMSPAEIARSIITVVNSGVVQGTLQLRASTPTGEWDFDNTVDPDAPPQDGRVALHGSAAGSFQAVGGLSEAPAPGTSLQVDADGNLRLAAVYHGGLGDSNTQRTQGAVIIENNQITEAHAIGIWSDPGNRGTDPEDDRSFGVGGSYLQLPPAGNSQLGGAINFPELNDSVDGGVAPGVVIQNNIVDRAGYTGIKVDGETRPMVIEWNHLTGLYFNGTNPLDSPGDLMIADGYTFAIDAGGTRVVFEFEEMNGAGVAFGGSGVAGGDGFVDGHVPVYYRLGGGGPNYNPNANDPVRDIGSSIHEIMLSIYEAIQGSILVTNGMVELVRPSIGPSLTGFDSPLQQAENTDPPFFPRPLPGSDSTSLDFLTPAIYLEGVTGIYGSQAFQKQIGTGRSPQLNFERPAGGGLELGTDFNSQTGVASSSPFPMLPIAEAPQPLAKVVNNTVRGSDGTEGAILEDGSLSPAIELPNAEPNDTLFAAVDPKLEVTHRGAYFASGTLGDNDGFLSPLEDVDLFKVELDPGDRLIVDIDTADDGPATHLRVFDSSGIEVFIGESGAITEHLHPGSTVANPIQDQANDRDGFIDFTALEKDTYYVGVSSDGNESYEVKSLAERTEGTGGVGDYDVAIEVLAPRQFVFSIDNHPLDPFGAEQLSGNITGTSAPSLINTTFTISQIPDYLIPTRAGDAYAGVNADGNRVTFQFTNGTNRVVLANGNINVPLLQATPVGDGYRVPDIMRAIANAINGFLNNPALPNHEVGNGPNGLDGPITRVTAQALGGRFGDNVGIDNMTRQNGCTFELVNCPVGLFGSVDYDNGFGHDRAESGSTNIVANGTLSDSQGTTELYTWIHNAAKIELSPEARAAGLRLGPDNTGLVNPRLGNASYATESDQLLAEQGIHVSSGVSAALLNNVVVNAHQSIVQEESSVFGFGGRIDESNPDISPKQGSVVAAGNTFQFDDHRNTLIRSDVSWWVGFGGTINDNFALDGSLSTDLRTGPSNIAGGNSDFNFVVRHPGTPGQVPGGFTELVGGDLLEDGAAGRFTPGINSAIIDSAVDSIDPLPEVVTLTAQLGIPTRAIESPDRDFSGQLRADEPTMAPPGGIGADVFKDRGALDRADFVGPSASLETPQDNDFAGTDFDPANSFVNRSEGIFTEFRILVQDLGDDSNPFVGSGIDPTTVIVPPIEGLRDSGANITLFENERLLEEGIDYTFSFDETRGVITLKALAGVWRNDRAYRIQLNNRDRTVLVSPSSSAVNDGDQITLVSNDGGTLIFEFEYGYLLEMPEAITLQIPRSGTNQGGLIDGGVFTVDDGINPQVVFEFDSNGTTVPGSIAVPLPTQPTPIDSGERALFLEQIATNVVDAVQSVIDDPTTPLNVDVRRDGTSIIITSERDTRVDTSTSGLVIVPTTLGLQVPAAGADAGGVAVGDTFTVNDGQRTQQFQFVDGNNPAPVGVIGVDISGAPDSAAVADLILAAINSSVLDLDPTLVGRTVHLDLPMEGSAEVSAGRLRPVSVSLTPTDGQLIEVTPVDGDTPIVFEINRTDEFIFGTGTINDGVAPGNIAIDINRQLTANELAVQVEQVITQTIQSQPIDGLNEEDIRAVGKGILRLGGEEGLAISVTGDSIDLVGSPGVVGPSTLEVFGPLFLEVPFTAPTDGDQFTIFDDNGNAVVFEFDSNTILTNFNAVRITISQFDDQDTVADAVVQAINNSTVGLTAINQGNGAVSLGRIGSARVDTTGSAINARRGIVTDGEFISITQGNRTVEYEFESVTNGGGVTGNRVPVPFQPGSTPQDVANSLAAAMSSNDGGLTFDPEVTPEGLVVLNDIPGTVIDLANAPSIILTGVPGGATPISIAPDDTDFDVNQAILTAINGLTPGASPVASDRGGATLFLEGGPQVQGPVESFFLPAIKDLSGNALAPNRPDNTTQFTLLLPTVGLDFGDAPDPRGIEPGRYASLLSSDGARHVVTPELTLGTRVDAEPDSQTTLTSDGDDLVIAASHVGTLLQTSSFPGGIDIAIQAGIDPLTRDGDTVTLRLADRTVTLEFDTDGIFEESNFAIAPIDPTSTASILDAIDFAVRQSGLAPAAVESTGGSVRVFSDDEDGVSFVSDLNPNGNLSKGINTPISVTVTGGGFLQAWIDFNADGDWDDPGELIIDPSLSSDAIFADTGLATTRVFDVTVPEFASPPNTAVSTYARFRVSREGGLSPNGLALSGEVEDYQVALVPGTPPTIGDDQRELSYSVQEDGALFVLDQDGQATTTPDDDGLLVGIVDPDGDAVGIFRGDTGPRQLFDDNGVFAGNLDLADDGTFTFVPASDFNGPVSFTARVTEVKITNPENELVNPNPITITIDVVPVNDKPFATTTPVESSATTDEDTSITFLASDLIDPFYLPGPANESDQTLVFQRVFSAAKGESVSSEGGTLEIQDGGRSVLYTPALDYNGSPDTFQFVVADFAGTTVVPRSADVLGTVTISVNAINDDPVAGPDTFGGQEDTNLSIAINGNGTLVGILDNDVAGPQNEIDPPESQTVSLVADQFPVQTERGGTVRNVNGQLVYTPPGLYSGPDTFTYRIQDSLGAESVGTVTVIVGGENDAPVFEGINGERDPIDGSPVTSLDLPESKPNDQATVYNLDTWFSDPENDSLTYQVVSSDESIVEVDLSGSVLTLTRKAFEFGQVNLTVTASDATFNTQQIVSVNIVNENDPPEVIGSLDPLTGDEDNTIVRSLSTVFRDPDGDVLDYEVARLGDIIRPSDSQIAAHPLVQSIILASGQIRIVPQPDQSGSVEIEIEAADDSARVSDVFTLTVNPVPDAPVATDDGYNVSVGSTLNVLNPANGLLRNDFDTDGDPIVVAPEFVGTRTTTFGEITVNEDGTFVYVNRTGNLGEVDSFTYQIVDQPTVGQSQRSEERTVTLTLNQSQYQNPIEGLEEDVNADGFISPIDALRVINFLARRSPESGAVAVSDIGAPPPDYFDTDGNGFVSPNDALRVINRLANLQGNGEGEGVSGTLRASSGVTFATLSGDFLPSFNTSVFDSTSKSAKDERETTSVADSTDALFGAGIEIDSSRSSVQIADAVVAGSNSSASSQESVDDVLSDLMTELESDLGL